MAGNVPAIGQLAQTYKTNAAALRALNEGKITQENYVALVQHNAANADFFEVEKSDAQPLTPEQQAVKQNAELDNQIVTAGMKVLPEKTADLSKTLAAMNPEQKQEVLTLLNQIGEARKADKPTTELEAQLDEKMRPFILKGNGVETASADITAHRSESSKGEQSTSFTTDLQAPKAKMEKHTRRQEKQEMARYYDEKTGTWIEAESDSKEDLKANKAALKQKRAELKDDKKAAQKDAKAKMKALEEANEKYQQARIAKMKGEATEADVEAAEQEMLAAREDARAAVEKREDAVEEYAQVRQAHKAAKGKGIGGDTRAFNKNVKANNRMVDREVYFTEAEADAAKAANPDNKGNIKVASKDDLNVLMALSMTAESQLEKAESPEAKALWTELANLFKDENGNPVDLDKVDTRKVQNALIDITGGDMKLDLSEQDVLRAELKDKGVSGGDIRHLFKTYGFDVANPTAKRIVNGLKEAAPVLVTMGLAQLLTRNRSKAVAHAEDRQTATSTAEQTVTTVAEDTQSATATATAHAEAWTEDQVFSYVDEYGRTRDLRIAGQFAEDTQTASETAKAYAKAVATATAKASASATAFASATAAAEAVAKLSPLGLVAAPALAFLAGFTKHPVETSAAKGATTEKMATYVEVFNKNKNKNIGNQIIQMAGQITGDEAVDRALIVAVLDHDIGAQNTTPTTRELRATLEHLKAIQNEVKNMKTVVENPPEPVPDPTPSPSVNPTPTPEPEIHKHEEIKSNFKFDVVGAGPASYVEACYGVRYGTPEFNAILNALYEQNPGLKGNNYKLNTPVFMPDVTVNGKEYKPDLKKRPAKQKLSGKKDVKYNGNQGRDEYYGPGKTHTTPHARMTEDQAREAARRQQQQ